MITGIVSDHGGYALKEEIKKHFTDIKWKDYGCFSEESVDYPDMAKSLALAILKGEADRGIAICGTGIGISIALNRFKNIRAALCHDLFTAEMARKHNDANILSMGGRIIDNEKAFAIVDIFFSTEFEGGRHKRRVEKLETMV
jgi:ribose 5-phosphate isomerase B